MESRALVRVLITGATSGLGRAMAVELGRRGWRIAITGRRESKLRDVADATLAAGAGDLLPLVGSVTDHATVQSHYEQIRARWGGLDWAILNAGVADSCAVDNFTAQNYRWTFDTNLFGVCEWIEAILPDMLSGTELQLRGGEKVARGAQERSAGPAPVIAGISSPGGWRGFPRMGSYSASKSALSTMLESLRVELRGRGVDVVTVCPGWVKSEITDRNPRKSMWMLLEAEDGARRIIRGIERRKRVVHFPFPVTHFIRYLIRPLPGWVFDPMARRLVRPSKRPYVDESAEEARAKEEESRRQAIEKLKDEARRE
jgi:NAD(P)-dependent dehydrogenase (short-subunit alcohol dehydrogenase family)